MGESRIKPKIVRLLDLYDRLKNLYRTKNDLKNKSVHYSPKYIDIQISNVRKSILSVKTSVYNELKSTIVESIYELNGVRYSCRLTNISKDELTYLLVELARLRDYKLKILEIKEIPTYIGKV